ncbi:MAG TPA: glycerol-3-phosphate 1-O-acyltransferase PlsY [Gammaproteobacteria bacterium]|nr:glycerol-3-phosphate 1-O-acyltransferase PlsY [Gammaproteobacteria bacterium]
MVSLALKMLASYLLGSVIGSLLVGRFKGGVDIRTMGSGNPGGTNALRTQGKAFAFWVMVIDVGKGVLATAVIAPLALPFAPDTLAPGWVAALCGAAAVVGHVFPVWYEFRGGKGAATLIGVLSVIAPLALVPVLTVFALVLMSSGYVGLSTMIATASLPLYALIAESQGAASPLFAFGIAMTVFIVFTHRSNIARMRQGVEHRFEKAMLLRRRS